MAEHHKAGWIRLRLVPITLRQANAFVTAHHRHNKAARGWKFGVGLVDPDGQMVGVAIGGRPVARALDDGTTLEVSRTCTLGTRNANSMLYGAMWRAARALGYLRGITYTQDGETGASLLACGWLPVADLPPRGSWAQSTIDPDLKAMRDPVGNGGVKRVRWEIHARKGSQEATCP